MGCIGLDAVDILDFAWNPTGVSSAKKKLSLLLSIASE